MTKKEKRPGEFRTYGDLADFLERLLEDRLLHDYEIDGFESVPFASKPGKKYWYLEVWRCSILDIAGVHRPAPEGEWMHPSARPHLKQLIPILRYLDLHDDQQ